MIDRAFAQHAGPAEHRVGQDGRRRRVRRRPTAARCASRWSAPNIATTCVPTAPARCMAPESFDTTARATARMPASVGRSLLPREVDQPIDPACRSSGSRRFDLPADLAIGVGADHHDAPVALLDQHVRQFGKPLGQPLLGAAVGRAGREHRERLVEVEADLAQHLPRPVGVGPHARVQRPRRDARARWSAPGSTRPGGAAPRGFGTARVRKRARQSVAKPQRSAMPDFDAIRPVANEFGNSSAASKRPPASAAASCCQLVQRAHAAAARQRDHLVHALRPS